MTFPPVCFLILITPYFFCLVKCSLSTFSNGPLEGSINKIKLIKRIAYGYRNFQNYKYRVLLSFKDKQISNKSQSAFAA
ncbi:hypothetical protein BW732_02200 [Vagococcus penaei]|uniref:Transposase IS204/IS1001/IS1096/IS1165 DDE domain-containing protein n=1 Tax=Vagococcus penaei TaxID=633807 RepID=A0A1Q2D471_9ENTE|nr:hypothetical protein BW732_02200 [Vagococcus penaei]